MRERNDLIARRVCLALAVVLVLRIGYVAFRPNPLAGLGIPALPTLASTNAPAATNAPAGPAALAAAGTNRPAGTNAAAGTNSLAGTNSPAGTNSLAGTNATASSPSNSLASKSAEKPGTNAPAGTNATAVAAKPGPGPEMPPPGMPGGLPPGMMMPGMMPGMMPMGRGPGGGGPAKPLAPLAQARVDKIIQSEILGPVPHPVPMALLGIAGRDAFIRTTTGQSGLVREGTEFGGIKLVRIGTNRVLVEEAGTQKELTIFNGAGGESLLPKPQ